MAQVEELFPDNPAPAAGPAAPVDESPTQWFVQLKGSPKAGGGSAAALAQARQEFRDDAAAAGVQVNVRYQFETLFNGLSVSVKPSDLNKLRNLNSVEAIYPVVPMTLPIEEQGPGLDLATAITQTQADIAQNTLGLTGAGVKVGIIDTGVDFDHPDLGGCFGPGCRVEVGYDLVGDAYNNDSTSATFNPVPTPDAIPDDCAGHGSHVAGIVGANGVVKGVAPGVSFGAYRVFGCNGSTSADVMVAALERAYNDGMNVINMSIGSAFQWPQYPTAQASDRLVENGVVVVASAGNDGTRGLYASSAPALGSKVISVASHDNIAVRASGFTISPDNKAIGYLQATGAPAAPLSGSFPMARTGTATSTTDACSTLPAGSLTGKVALIRRGTCSFYIKAKNAEAAGAAAVVLYNNVAGIQSITVAGTPAVVIPVVSVDAASGVLINNRLATGPVTMTWQNGMVVYVPNVATGNLISSFSSYGMSPDLDIKPDLGAPGGSIYSTFPLELGGYAVLSGTSMSSPHVAGTVALYLQAHPGTPAEEIRGRLQNTAKPQLWSGSPGTGLLDHVYRQGAGMVQIADAVLAPAYVTPGKLPLGESQAGPATRTLTIHNTSAADITYTLSSVPAVSTGPNTFTLSFFTGFASVAFSAPSVTVPAGGVATVDVTITANAGLPDHSLYSGYVVLTPASGQKLRVPYAGFKGDYQSIQVLTSGGNGFPWLAKLTGGSFFNQPGGASYTLQGDDFPFLIIHLDHQARKLNVEVRDAATGQPVHPVFYYMEQDEYLPRNSAATSFFSFVWDGTRLHSNGNKHKVKEVPNGNYVLVVKVLKALGDENNPADWETWTSPVITLARP
jgi:subtilisin family serine protease